MVEPINLYNVDYFFDKALSIDLRVLKEDLREVSVDVDRVTIEEPQEGHREAL